MSADTHYFLCANTGHGIYSICDEITRRESTKFQYIIKGGQGGGKSFYLKTLANAFGNRGINIECLHSSRNPETIDGIFLPSSGIAYLDGDEPYFIEPEFPGVSAKYINLDEFYDLTSLFGKKDILKELTAEYKSHFKRAYAFLSAASEINQNIHSPLVSENIIVTITRRTNGICEREFNDTGKEGQITCRFLSAFTYEGVISCFDTVRTLCNRVCTIDNDYGFAPLMLRQLLDQALKSGYKVILSPSPLYPDITEHLLIPELSLAFLSINSETQYDFDTFKHLRLDALIDKDKYREIKYTLREERRLNDLLLEQARQNLLFAKNSYDRLEKIYCPHIDFDGIQKLAEKHSELC